MYSAVPCEVRSAEHSNSRIIVCRLISPSTRLIERWHIPQAHDVPGGGDGSEASDFFPLGVATGEASGEEVVEQGVAQTLGGGDDFLGPLNRLVDGVEHRRNRLLLGDRRKENRESAVLGRIYVRLSADVEYRLEPTQIRRRVRVDVQETRQRDCRVGTEADEIAGVDASPIARSIEIGSADTPTASKEQISLSKLVSSDYLWIRRANLVRPQATIVSNVGDSNIARLRWIVVESWGICSISRCIADIPQPNAAPSLRDFGL
ncbi:MAG: hypothetical protein OXN86_06710 [Chloroflexota bacterium]|nr:hypothetical protein [Chloroflexota bacterium]